MRSLLAAYLGADLHAVALNADIPDVSNASRELLLNLPELIKQTEILAACVANACSPKFEEEAAKQSVNLTMGAMSAVLALFGEAAATEARYFRHCLARSGRLATRHREHLRKR